MVQDWIDQLLELSEKKGVKNEPPTLSLPSPLPQQVAAPPNIAANSQARLYHQFTKPDTPTFSRSSTRASHTPPYIPPPPTTRPPPLPPTPGQQISYLPLFNQTASQRRLGVEYTAQFFGPPHAGEWAVKCLGELLLPAAIPPPTRGSIGMTDNSVGHPTVNNIEQGQGTGPSKQLAKEEAAKQAFYAMGWST